MIGPESKSEAPRRPEPIARLRRHGRAALRLIYPPLCIACQAPVAEEGALCSDCWPKTGFLRGLCCDTCGFPLPGQSDQPVQCDRCLRDPPPWDRARAAIRYDETARLMVLGFKHNDRTELARPFGRWMAGCAQDLLTPESLLVPVPLHPFRLIRRKYNQAALLAQAVARETGAALCVDLLRKTRHTPPQEGLDAKARRANVGDVFALHPKRRHLAQGRPLILIDDVLTTGATLRAAFEALRPLDAPKIDVLCLARVAKDT